MTESFYYSVISTDLQQIFSTSVMKIGASVRTAVSQAGRDCQVVISHVTPLHYLTSSMLSDCHCCRRVWGLAVSQNGAGVSPATGWHQHVQSGSPRVGQLAPALVHVT